MISKNSLLKLFTAALVSQTSLAWAQTPRFLMSQEDIEDLEVSGFQERISLGFQLYSVVPTSRPVQTVSGNTIRDFRYQITNAFGAEIAFKVQDNLKLALASSFEFYESRIERTDASTEITTVKFRTIPIEGIARYEWPTKFWAPVVEGGLGFGFNKFTAESTNLSQASIEDSSSSLLAHVAAGANFAWLDDTNLGILLGYRMMFLSQKDLDFAIFNIRRKSISGIFAKATLSYQF